MAKDGRRYKVFVGFVSVVVFISVFYHASQGGDAWLASGSPRSGGVSIYQPFQEGEAETEEDDYFYDNLSAEAEAAGPAQVPRNGVENGNVSYKQMRIADGGNGSTFDYTKNDVLVFLHVQKTGGTTFERYLVRQLELPTPCKCLKARKRCRCNRPRGSAGSARSPWLFSRFSTGWTCGLHSDWTELVVSGCVDRYFDRRDRGHAKRRYFITTILREPVGRFISEFRHVQRGATWQGSRHLCNGRPPSRQELPPCLEPAQGWSGATLQQFLDCPSNLAFNRQTRMLADLTKVGCYNQSAMAADQRQRLMLRSAKENLLKMAFFGLQDEMRKSQYLFERTFNMTFTKPMVDMTAQSQWERLTDDERRQIKAVNELDIELYHVASRFFVSVFHLYIQYAIDLQVEQHVMTSGDCATVPAFVYPRTLSMFTDNNQSLRQIVTLYNPYEFDLDYKVLSTAPALYSVQETSGRLRPQSLVDIVIRRKVTSTGGASIQCTVDKFRVQVRKTTKPRLTGHSDIVVRINDTTIDPSTSADQRKPAAALDVQRQPSRHFESVRGNLADRELYQTYPAYFHWVLLAVGALCIACLCCPYAEEQIESAPYWYPHWLRLTVSQKLIASYILGLLTVVLLQI